MKHLLGAFSDITFWETEVNDGLFPWEVIGCTEMQIMRNYI